ncbi:flavodoxin family protein [Candidatus Bathyarchaeota archaeon]|nr:flavodoxin family protein [Candidatus Bathyarchaeota archaeon]
MQKIRVVGVSGSPRKGKNTEALLNAALDAALNLGAEVREVSLSDYQILCCDGCNVCVKENRCPLDEKDDMEKIKSELVGADSIIFAAPSYFGSVPGLMKNMMDRSRPLKMSGHKLSGKVASVLALSGLRYGGAEQVAEALVRFALMHGMVVVGGCGDPLTSSYFGISSLQSDSGWRRVNEDSIALENAKSVGKRVFKVASALKRL